MAPTAEEPARPASSGPTEEIRVAVFQAIGRGFRFILGHPVTLLAGVPLLMWQAVTWWIAPRHGGIVSLAGWAPWFAWASAFLLAVLTGGFVYAFVAAVVRERPSVSRATLDVLRWSPSLIAAAAVRDALLLGPFLWLRPPRVTPVAFLADYISVRLSFWSVAIVIDGRGLIDGARAAWELARGNWWRLAGLTLMTFGAKWTARRWVPVPYGEVAIDWLIALVGYAAIAMMYLQRVGILPRIPTIGDVVAEHAAQRRGVGDLVSKPVRQ